MNESRPFKSEKDLHNPFIEVQSKLKNKFCSKPFEFLEISESGEARVCCSAWLPQSIGNLSKNSIADLWNSQTAKAIRNSIHDGTFDYCRWSNCPEIAGNTLPQKNQITDPLLRKVIDDRATILEFLPKMYNLSYDDSCNLTCPSCRNIKINVVNGEKYEFRKQIQLKLIETVFGTSNTQDVILNITGSGDPFASKLFREFLLGIDGEKFPNVKINFQTNGIMFTPKYFDLLHKIHANINSCIVSFDAATENTYNKTRRGGNWNKLLTNMDMINNKRESGIIKWLGVEFVVQMLNYKEVPQLVTLLDRYPAIDKITFSLINNWGTYSAEEFESHAIWKSHHPEFRNFIQILKDPILDSKKIRFGNLSPYRALALSESNQNFI